MQGHIGVERGQRNNIPRIERAVDEIADCPFGVGDAHFIRIFGGIAGQGIVHTARVVDQQHDMDSLFYIRLFCQALDCGDRRVLPTVSRFEYFEVVFPQPGNRFAVGTVHTQVQIDLLGQEQGRVVDLADVQRLGCQVPAGRLQRADTGPHTE